MTPSISPDDIEAAAARIAPYVRETPIMRMGAGTFGLAYPVTLKLELFQHSGSFKARGAFNRMLANTVPAAGVIAASGGNHGAAVAYAARTLGHHAEIFVPELASEAKRAKLRRYGPTLHISGENYNAALAASAARAAQTGALVVHAYNQPEVLAGQGTLARELYQQAPYLDTVLVAVGGGGLIGGISAFYRTNARIISVEPERAPTLRRAFETGAPVDVDVGGIAADALGATRVGDMMFEIVKRNIRDAVLVSDEAILAAQRALWLECNIAAEPGGATALAALMSGVYRPAANEHVGVLVCGGNTGLDKLHALCLNP